MFRSTAAVLLAATTIFMGTALAGPFGLWMGMTIQEASNLAGARPGPGPLYELNRVPTPVPGLEHYVALITPGEGLCRVAARTAIVTTNATGG